MNTEASAGAEPAGEGQPERLDWKASRFFSKECIALGCVPASRACDDESDPDMFGFGAGVHHVEVIVDVPGTSGKMRAGFSQKELKDGSVCVTARRPIGDTRVTQDYNCFAGGEGSEKFGREVAKIYLSEHRAESESKAA